MMDRPSTVNGDLPLLSPLSPILQTASTQALEEKVTQWLWTGVTGALVTGEARVGKTTALEILAQHLSDRQGSAVPVFFTSLEQLDRPNIKSLNWQLCVDAEVKTTQRQASYQLSASFAQRLMDETHVGGVKQVVLLIDECQRLTPDQFNALADLYNKLRAKKRLLLIVFMGNDQETSQLVELMSSKAYAHIRGRFFRTGWCFQGLRSVKEVRDCLAQYDTLPHPFLPGCSIVEGVIPEAKASGFRLAGAAPMFWRVFRDYQKRYRLTDWGMESFTITTHALLADFFPRYGLAALNEEMIEAAIGVSCLVPSLVSPAPRKRSH